MARMAKKGKVFILSGPSGSGKTTLYQKVLAVFPQLKKSVSVTTRPKRPGEVQGRDYFFISQKMFLYKVRAGHFLEYEKFFGNYYGTPNKHIQDILRLGKSVLLCIDVKGAKTVLRRYPTAVTVFIKTPTLADLKRRLLSRGSEDLKTIQNRLKRVKLELQEAKNYDHVIVNDHLTRAQKALNQIVEQELAELSEAPFVTS